MAASPFLVAFPVTDQFNSYIYWVESSCSVTEVLGQHLPVEQHKTRLPQSSQEGRPGGLVSTPARRSRVEY